MTEFVQFESSDGLVLIVEADPSTTGQPRPVRNRSGATAIEASQTLEEAMDGALPALRRVMETIGKLAPTEHEIEFGIKLDAQAGAVVAKTGIEGHFTVKLTWKQQTPQP